MLTLLEIRNAGFTVGGFRKELAGSHREVLVRCECGRWKWVYLSRIKFKIEHGHKYRCRCCKDVSQSKLNQQEQPREGSGQAGRSSRADPTA